MNRNERLIARVLLTEAAKAGWEIAAVDDGQDVQEGKEYRTIEGALQLANELADDVRFHLRVPKARSATGKTINGWVFLIFGNGDEGLTVISDHSINLGRYDVGQDKDTPGATPNPHGFMEEVEAFIDGLEAHVKGIDGHKTSQLLAYAKTDRLELAAQFMHDQIQDIVRDHGVRVPEDSDELKPIEEQPMEIARLMAILAHVAPQE
jgi:hypothetical protein